MSILQLAMDPLLELKTKNIYLLTSVVLDGDNWQLTKVQTVIKDKYSLNWQLPLYWDDRDVMQQITLYKRRTWCDNRMAYNSSLFLLRIIKN